MATPFTPTPAQEMLGIEHPFYEMDQMIFCASALRSEPDVFVPQVGFALAESFVIHARSLLHFFSTITSASPPICSRATSS